MSVDLFVVRDRPLSWADALRACAAVAKANDGVSFWSMTDGAEDATAYFWKVGRAAIELVKPDPEDFEDGDPPELAKPYVVVSSRSGAWPWIEWTALALASELGADIFDPQNGDLVEPWTPEHDLPALRALHDEYLRDAKPALVSSWWGSVAAGGAGVRPVVAAIEGVAKDDLGIDARIPLSDDQVDVWHTYAIGDAAVKVSVSADGTLNVEGPPGLAVVERFARALARRLGVRFRRIDEYR